MSASRTGAMWRTPQTEKNKITSRCTSQNSSMTVVHSCFSQDHHSITSSIPPLHQLISYIPQTRAPLVIVPKALQHAKQPACENVQSLHVPGNTLSRPSTRRCGKHPRNYLSEPCSRCILLLPFIAFPPRFSSSFLPLKSQKQFCQWQAIRMP